MHSWEVQKESHQQSLQSVKFLLAAISTLHRCCSVARDDEITHELQWTGGRQINGRDMCPCLCVCVHACVCVHVCGVCVCVCVCVYVCA